MPAAALAARTGYAISSVSVVIAWWLLIVYGNYGGNWTALFCTGAQQRIPALLSNEHIWQVPHARGFDGQFYHFIAHDPLFSQGMADYVDLPRLRYNRILVPMLAHTLAFGQGSAIDPAYFAVMLAFVFLGVYWVASCARRIGAGECWGLAFLLVPGVIVATERLTAPDLALSALCAGFAYYAGRSPAWKVYLVLLLACLARETGALLCVAYCVWLIVQRKYAVAALFLTATMPAVLWFMFVRAHTPVVVVPTAVTPLQSVFSVLAEPLELTRIGGLEVVTRVLDWVALLGAWAAIALAVAGVRRDRPVTVAGCYFACLGAVLLNTEDWHRAYDFGRVLSPGLLLLCLQPSSRRRWYAASATAAVASRIAILWASECLSLFLQN